MTAEPATEPETTPATALRRNRDFQLLWSGAALSQFGTMMSMTAYPLLILALTGSAAWAGVVLAVGQLPNLVVQLPAGALVDRWNRKRMMIVCDAVRCVSLGTVALLLFSGVLQVWMLMPIAFVEGTCTVLFRLAEVGAVRNVVPQSQYASALAANQVRIFGAAFLGRPAGGFLFAAGRGIPFAADAVTYAVSMVTVLFTRGAFQTAQTKPSTRRSIWREAFEGLGWLVRQPYLRAVNVMVPVATVVLQILPLIVVVIATQNGISPGGIGLILLGFSIGGLTGSLAAGWLRSHLTLRSVVLGSPWLWALCCAAAAAFPQPAVLVISMAGVGIANAAWNVVVDAYQLAIIPDHLLGRVNASIRMVAYGAGVAGPAAAGVLLQRIGGVNGMWAVAGGLAVLAAGACLTPVLRREPEVGTSTAVS
jgi:MFS family permease